MFTFYGQNELVIGVIEISKTLRTLNVTHRNINNLVFRKVKLNEVRTIFD